MKDGETTINKKKRNDFVLFQLGGVQCVYVVCKLKVLFGNFVASAIKTGLFNL